MKKIIKVILQEPWIFILILTIFSFLIRLLYLGAVKEQIFDEVYFVEFAKNYLSHTAFFDIHPPLGKLILAVGLKTITGQVGWRIMPAIFGTLLIPLGYLTGKELTNPPEGKIVGIFAALILAFDGMLLVYSRIGLLDIFLAFFILLSFYLFLKFANTQKIIFLILAGLAVGLAAQIKYIGALILLVFLIIIIVKKLPLKKYLWPYIAFIIFLPIIIYLGFFLFNFPLNRQFMSEVINWHWQSFNYNFHLTATHPYASKWWGWFLLVRPIWLYFKDQNNNYIGIVGLGNPLVWWSAIVVIPVLFWLAIKKNKEAIIILAGFLFFWVFWAFFSRVLFLYHAIPSFLFLALGTAYLLEKLLKEKYGKIFVTLYFLILIGLFIFFLPVWMGLPINSAQFYHRTWFKSWI